MCAPALFNGAPRSSARLGTPAVVAPVQMAATPSGAGCRTLRFALTSSPMLTRLGEQKITHLGE